MHEGHHDHCCSGELEHTHSHGECGCCNGANDAATAGAGETVALLEYMLKHNEHHTIELEGTKQQLATMGLGDAAKQMDEVIGDYQKGNVRLAAVLAAIKSAL
ncbi:MAG: cobalt transporter [Oscillospiraceae bacterium]